MANDMKCKSIFINNIHDAKCSIVLAVFQIMVSPEARGSAWVSFDGRNRQEIKKNDA